MPNVAAWLRHSRTAENVVARTWPVDASIEDRQHALAMENVVAQIQHLRTHPAVATGLATGALTLHGWLFEIEYGRVLAYDGEAQHFVTIDNDTPPVAVARVPARSATPKPLLRPHRPRFRSGRQSNVHVKQHC